MTATRLASRATGVAATAAAALLLVAGSRCATTLHPRDDAMLRLAWSARPERIERCRVPSAAEQAEVAPHMRQTVVCEGSTARYQLEIFQDGRRLAVDTLRGGGLRRDRQLYVHRELAVPSGARRLEVRLAREPLPAPSATAPVATDAAATDAARARLAADAVPPSLVLDTVVVVRPREVLLVTYDRTSRRLRLVRGTP